MEMNLQLHHVVADITGVTGMKIIRAIVEGERNLDVLASYRDVRCRASTETIKAALERLASNLNRHYPAAPSVLSGQWRYLCIRLKARRFKR